MTALTEHMSSKSSSVANHTIDTPRNNTANMSALNTSQHPDPLVLAPINTNTGEAFPGLIPGLAGGLPAQEPAQSSTAPSRESTEERLNKLEALAADQTQEIYSLRYINSASREEAEGLRMRVADLEASLAGRLPATRLSPVSIKYNYSAMDSAAGHPKWETPAREKKRSRFATFFEQRAAALAASTPTRTVAATPLAPVKRSRHTALLQNMAAVSPTRKDSHVEETQATPVLKSALSISFTAHYHQIITPPPSNPIHVASCAEVDVDNDPFPGGESFGQPDFDFAAFTPASQYYHEMDFYGWLSAPHGQEIEEEDADPFPWGRSFHKRPDFDFAALVSPSKTGDVHGKEMQACVALHAPRPIRLRAPLLNNTDF